METLNAVDLEGHLLSRFGFVHATGISMSQSDRSSGMTNRRLFVKTSQCGFYSINYGALCAVTSRGEIWIRQIPRNDRLNNDARYQQLLKHLCPNGEGTPIIGEDWRVAHISTYELLCRLSDPTWNEAAGDFPLVRTLD